MFVSSTRGELAGVLTSVSGIIPPATGEPYLLSCIYHLTLYLLPSRAEIGICHDFQLPAWRGTAMSYHRTKHKPLFLGYWAKKGWQAQGQTGIFLSQFGSEAEAAQ